jgi:hypothetical protein
MSPDLLEHDHRVRDGKPVHEDKMLADEERERRALEIQKKNTRETNGALVQRILDAVDGGVCGHQNLADHLGCSLREIRTAMTRLRRRFDLVGQ